MSTQTNSSGRVLHFKASAFFWKLAVLSRMVAVAGGAAAPSCSVEERKALESLKMHIRVCLLKVLAPSPVPVSLQQPILLRNLAILHNHIQRQRRREGVGERRRGQRSGQESAHKGITAENVESLREVALYTQINVSLIVKHKIY